MFFSFAIDKGHVTYQCRFLQSEVYKQNQAAQRIVITEFGTCAVPDPCQTIFQRYTYFISINEYLTLHANCVVEWHQYLMTRMYRIMQ